MKHFSILILAVLFTFSVNAQNIGKIQYTETIQLNIEAPEGMDISELLGNSMTNYKELVFNTEASIYNDSDKNESHDKEIESDDGNFRMVVKTGNDDNVLYTNLKSGNSLFQTNFMGKQFLVESEKEKLKWKLTDEKIKYLDYVCHKAELTIQEEGEDDKHVVAWFTSEIPASVGPDSYSQLPGAILMINVDDGEREIKATEVFLDDVDTSTIVEPSKGKRVSHDEYDVIVKEKMAEMDKMYGGQGGMRIIRG